MKFKDYITEDKGKPIEDPRECSRYYYVNLDDKRRIVVEKELKLFV